MCAHNLGKSQKNCWDVYAVLQLPSKIEIEERKICLGERVCSGAEYMPVPQPYPGNLTKSITFICQIHITNIILGIGLH